MKTTCLFLLCMVPLALYSQSDVDRNVLLKNLRTVKQDSNKVYMLIKLGNTYVNEDKKTAEKYFIQAGNLSKKIGHANGTHEFYAVYLNLYTQQGKFESAIPIADEAINWFKKTNDSLGLAKSYVNLGATYLQMSDYENTAVNFEKGRTLFAKLKNYVHEGQVYDMIQALEHSMHQYEKGVEYGLKAVEKLEKRNKPEILCYVYLKLGLNYVGMSKFDNARNYFNKALLDAERSNEKPVELMYYLNVGYTYLLEGNYDKAKPYADKGLRLAKQFGSEEGISHAYWGLAEYNLNKKDYPMSQRYADSASILVKKNNFRELKLRFLLLNSKLSYALQNPEKGSQYSKDYEAFRDSLLNESQQRITTFFEKKYETIRKDAQIKEQNAALSQRKLWNYFFASAVLTLLAIGFIIYRNFKHRQTIQQQKISELETEKQLAATEAVLRGEEQERSRLSKDLHDGLGGMLSGVKLSFNAMKENLIMTPENTKAFERSIDQLDNSIREMRRVAHNMLPVNLLKYDLDSALREFCAELNRGASLKVSYQSIDMEHHQFVQEISIACYRIIQELVNNSLKHSDAQHLLVQSHLSKEEGILHITVEDDGKGFDKNMLPESKGIGWRNIQNRVQLIKGRIDLNSGAGKGTSVLIEIPIT